MVFFNVNVLTFKITSAALNSGKFWKLVGNRFRTNKVTGTLTIRFDLKGIWYHNNPEIRKYKSDS